MIILVTGGASGLGGAITKRLASALENIIYFTYSSSEITAKKIEEQFSNAFSIKCNFTIKEELEALKLKIQELNIDILINNAYHGGYEIAYFHKRPSSDFLTDFKQNIIPTIEISQAAINLFRKKKHGKLLTVLTSFLVNIPPMGSAVYTANKAYLQQLTKLWAVENARFNITSNSISPSLLETKLTSDVDERLIEQLKENHPLKKLLTIEEVADLIYFFTTTSSQLNGVDLVINSAVNIK